MRSNGDGSTERVDGRNDGTVRDNVETIGDLIENHDVKTEQRKTREAELGEFTSTKRGYRRDPAPLISNRTRARRTLRVLSKPDSPMN